MIKRKRRSNSSKIDLGSGLNIMICSDDHLRSTAPQCRIDGFQKTMFKKLKQRQQFGKDNDIQILLNAGDIGEKSYFVKDPNSLGWTADLFNKYADHLSGNPYKTYCVPGNHDLPGHDIENISACVFQALTLHENFEHLKKIKYHGVNIYGAAWDCDVPVPESPEEENILVIHKMVIENKPLYPGQEAPKGLDLLKKYPEYNLIISGDNHNTFVQELDGRILINPGSMLRLKSDQTEHKPCFFIYNVEKHEYKKIFYNCPPASEAITRVHIENKQRTQEGFDKYAEAVERADISELSSFEENLEKIITESKPSLKTRSFIDSIQKDAPAE